MGAEPATRVGAELGDRTPATKQLPMTADMVAFLQKDSSAANDPVQTTLIILGMAAVLPAFFTVLFFVNGVAASQWWFMLGEWAFFLGFGGLASFAIIHSARQEKRDLAGAVFNRFAGRFSIQVQSGKGGTYVQVVVGGRALSKERAPELESYDSGSGSVDYFPVSGELIEVRDESGTVMWNRFGAAPSQSG